MITEVILPQLGQTMIEGTIIEWFSAEGDRVDKDSALFSFESDKATLEVQAPEEGVLRKVLVPAGATCPVLAPVALIADSMSEDISGYGTEGEKVIPLVTHEQEADRVVASMQDAETEAIEGSQIGGRIFVSPRARALARTKNVNLALIQGSGAGGRIVFKDVMAYLETKPKVTPVAQRMADQKGIDLAAIEGTGLGGKIMKKDVETADQALPMLTTLQQDVQVARSVPITGLRKTIAERMSASLHTAARVTLLTEANAAELVRLRQRLVDQVKDRWGFKPGYNDLFVLIVAKALAVFQYMNARLHGDVIEELANINVGLAVDTDKGLKVIVVRNADRAGLEDIGTKLRDLVERAHTGMSLPDELSGGTFTITNLGTFGIDGFTPIMNPPEIAILGIGRIIDKPVVVDSKIDIRPMITLSLSFDHRLVDGAPAARFFQHIVNLVEEPSLLLI